MRIVGRGKLDEFVGKHADARSWIKNWIADAEGARCSYASVSFIANNVVIFNVKGNRYRLEVLVAYETAVAVVRWAGTHAEYTKRQG